MPVVGFVGEVDDNNELQEATIEKKQEVVEKAKKVIVHIPKNRIPQILEGFDCVVVNSFGDDYHCSDKEREERNKFAKDAKKIKSMKRIYRKLDEYVVAVREHLKFLDKVAEGNGVYEPDEFKKLFFKGKINIVGMRFPKYKGPNRKDINYKYLAEFVLSNADPSEIIPKWQRGDYEDPDMDNIVDEMFTKEELEYIFTPLSEKEARFEYELFDPNEDDQDGTNVSVTLTTKQSKKLIKYQPELVAKLKEMKRERHTIDRLNDTFLHNTIADDISEIAKYDANYQYVSKSDIPEFSGDIMDDKNYYKYMQRLQEFEDNNTYVNYHGKDKTLGEVKELELKEILERDDWNIRNFAENKLQEKKLKKLQKRDKRKEKQLKKHLMDIQKRRESRMNNESYKEYKKKAFKKKKKDKKKDVKETVKNTKKDINQILLGDKSQSFKEYKEKALDLTGLFGGKDE